MIRYIFFIFWANPWPNQLIFLTMFFSVRNYMFEQILKYINSTKKLILCVPNLENNEFNNFENLPV